MQLNEKLKKLKALKNYIENVDVRANNILYQLSWNKEDTLKNLNFKHQVKNNITRCATDDLIYLETFTQLHNIQLEPEEIQKVLNESVVPQISTQPSELYNKFSDMQMNFNREQKLKIYDFIIEKTGKLTEPEHFSISQKVNPSNSDKFLSFAEIVALRRNLKRRRLKHSVGKNPPLSVTEEFRNLIELQMDAFKEYNNQMLTNKEKNDIRDNKSSNFQNNIFSKDVNDYFKPKDIKKKTMKCKIQFSDQKSKSSYKTKSKAKTSKNKKLKSHHKTNFKHCTHDKMLKKEKRKHRSKENSSEKYYKLKKRKKDNNNKKHIDD